MKLNTFFIILVLGGLFSCNDDEMSEPEIITCDKTGVFRGTNVCSQEGGAAFEVEEDGEIAFYIANNFSDFEAIEDFEWDDSLTVSFEIISYPAPGLLCGPLIVAPLVEISCLTKME